MAEDKKKKPDDGLYNLIPRNANIGIVAIANGGGTGIVATSDSPVIGIATSGGSPSVDVGHDNTTDEDEEQQD